jgi:hypothetical protein
VFVFCTNKLTKFGISSSHLQVLQSEIDACNTVCPKSHGGVSKCCNGIDHHIARQQLCKHGPTHNNGGTCDFYVMSCNNGGTCVFYVMTSSTIETVFSAGLVQSAYKRSEFRSELVQ